MKFTFREHRIELHPSKDVAVLCESDCIVLETFSRNTQHPLIHIVEYRRIYKDGSVKLDSYGETTLELVLKNKTLKNTLDQITYVNEFGNYQGCTITT